MTRQELRDLKKGDKIQLTLDVKAFTKFTELKPNPIWGKPMEIASIVRRELIAGNKMYVRGYVKTASGGEMSFAVVEGNVDYRLVP